jgi:thiol-disulfide isomerase/thioredoxin
VRQSAHKIANGVSLLAVAIRFSTANQLRSCIERRLSGKEGQVKKSALILAAIGLWLPWASSAQSADDDPPLNSASIDSRSTPRCSPEFVIHLTNGKEMLLSSLRGQVVALMFVHTTCPVCQHASQVLTKLYYEYGPRGFQPIDVAFNSSANLYVPEFVKNFDIRYPVGFSTTEEVAEYLNFPAGERFTIPQIVWIDSSGYIRAATPLKGGDEEMLTEAYWWNMIETLLKELTED